MERCTRMEHGFEGIYFPGTRSSNIAIIAVGGASCDEQTSVSMSRYLRQAGYNVLVLGFYLWEGLPKELVSIPVDYVEKAVKWLKQEKGISPSAYRKTLPKSDRAGNKEHLRQVEQLIEERRMESNDPN